MADVLRSCSKTGCRWPAAASLSFRYATRQVWLLDLVQAPDPSLYDLCPHHADDLRVPKGWERVDDRTDQEVMVEPSASDRAEEAARRRWAAVEPPPRHVAAARPQPQLVGAGSGNHGPRNRYAALVEQLPDLAAAQARQPVAEEPGAGAAAEHEGHDAAEPATQPPNEPAPRPGPAAAAAQLAAHPAATPRPAASEPLAAPEPAVPLADRGRMGPTTGAGRPPGPPVPTRDLAPRAADDDVPPAAATPDAPNSSDGSDEPLPGQLAIPVEDLGMETSGVVLPFELAGGRRRGKSG